MFTRPSVAQITSAYTGKVPALQARVKQEKQANNELSPDLRKLLALQDLTSDTEHAGIDQALQAPANPPTVNQSYQDRAKQIIQAKMAKAQQDAGVARKQQEGMIAKAGPGPVPEGIAQPRRQPEGIDQLPSNVGESYARGGIIAFSEGGYGKWLREMMYGNTTDAEKKRSAALEEKAKEKAEAPKVLAASNRLNEERERNMAEVRNPSPEGDPRLLRAPKGESVSTAAEDAAIAAEKPVQKTRVNNVKPAAQQGIATLPALPPELPAPAAGSPRAIMGTDMARDPDAESLRILQARERLLGAPDTSQYDALVNELRGQKEKLMKKPEGGYEGLMSYLSDIAAGPTTGNSGQAGSNAAERRRSRERANQEKANALSERMIDIAQKKLDTEYGYKKEGFALSEGERKAVFEARFNAAKAAGESDDRARTLAQQAVLERERNAATVKAAGIGASARQGQLMDIAEALMAKDPKLDLEAALTKAANLIGTVQTGAQNVKSRENYEKDLAKLREQFPKFLREGDSKTAISNRREYEAEKARIDANYGMQGGAGLNSLSATPATSAGVKILSIEPSPK